MKNSVKIACLALFFFSCSSVEHTVKEKSFVKENKEEKTELKENTRVQFITTERKIFIPGERSYIKASFKCDSLNNLLLNQIYELKTGSAKPVIKRVGDTIIFICEIDSLSVYESIKTKISDTSRTQETETTTKTKTKTWYSETFKKISALMTFKRIISILAAILVLSFLFKFYKKISN